MSHPCTPIILTPMTSSRSYVRNIKSHRGSDNFLHLTSKSSTSNALMRRSKKAISLSPARRMIQCAIKIQTVVRRFLVLRRYDKEEKLRIERRMVIQAESISVANSTVINFRQEPNVQLKIFHNLSVQIYKVASKILNKNFCGKDFHDTVKFLFRFLNKSSNDKSISRLECRYLLLDVLNCPYSKTECFYVVEHLVDDLGRISYESFTEWFIEERNRYSSILEHFRHILNEQKVLKKTFTYKTIYLESLIIETLSKENEKEELKIYDQCNPPRFICKYCGLISTRPLILCKHINYCKKQYKKK